MTDTFPGKATGVNAGDFSILPAGTNFPFTTGLRRALPLLTPGARSLWLTKAMPALSGEGALCPPPPRGL